MLTVDELKKHFQPSANKFITCDAKFNIIDVSLKLNSCSIIKGNSINSCIYDLDSLNEKLNDKIPIIDIQINLDECLYNSVLFKVKRQTTNVHYFILVLDISKYNKVKNSYDIMLSNNEVDNANYILTVLDKIKNDLIDNNSNSIELYLKEISNSCNLTKKNNAQINVYTSIVNNEVKLDITNHNIHEFLQTTINELKEDFNSTEYKFTYKSQNRNVCANFYDIYLKVALWEIISNSFKFCGEQKKVSLILNDDGDFAIISVIDNGKGFDDSIVNTAFQPFVKFYDDKIPLKLRGSGLGLAIAEKIIIGFGGNITIERTKNKTKNILKVFLPLADLEPSKSILKEEFILQSDFSELDYYKLTFANFD